MVYLYIQTSVAKLYICTWDAVSANVGLTENTHHAKLFDDAEVEKFRRTVGVAPHFKSEAAAQWVVIASFGDNPVDVCLGHISTSGADRKYTSWSHWKMDQVQRFTTKEAAYAYLATWLMGNSSTTTAMQWNNFRVVAVL